MIRPAATITLATLVALGIAGPAVAAAADPVRGKALYETRCVACHNTSVHQSTSRKAMSFEEIRRQVTRWSGQLGASWDAGDVDNITVYLNDLYYKLPCPPGSCPAKTGSLTPALASQR